MSNREIANTIMPRICQKCGDYTLKFHDCNPERSAKERAARIASQDDDDGPTDTPETDSALHGVWYRGDHGSTIPDLCRRLERQRNATRKELRHIADLLDAHFQRGGTVAGIGTTNKAHQILNPNDQVMARAAQDSAPQTTASGALPCTPCSLWLSDLKCCIERGAINIYGQWIKDLRRRGQKVYVSEPEFTAHLLRVIAAAALCPNPETPSSHD
jgi:hypothetical protein